LLERSVIKEPTMERIGTILVAPTTERKTEPDRFGAALRNAAGQVAAGVAGGVSVAAPYLPGGAVLAGALRAAPAALAGSVAASLTGGATAAGSGGGELLEATRTIQQEAQTFNLQYLQLQEAMQRESREFTAVTNVMKVRHDSAKAAINNVH
jgi:hypothetical protein